MLTPSTRSVSVMPRRAAHWEQTGVEPHAWDVAHEAGMISVTCTLTHSMGHSESVTMPPVAPDNSGKKNSIQQVASAITYLQRYSLLAITGLAAKDQDDDGIATGEPLRVAGGFTLDGLGAPFVERIDGDPSNVIGLSLPLLRLLLRDLGIVWSDLWPPP